MSQRFIPFAFLIVVVLLTGTWFLGQKHGLDEGRLDGLSRGYDAGFLDAQVVRITETIRRDDVPTDGQSPQMMCSLTSGLREACPYRAIVYSQLSSGDALAQKRASVCQALLDAVDARQLRCAH
jgi:hypothetical protein